MTEHHTPNEVSSEETTSVSDFDRIFADVSDPSSEQPDPISEHEKGICWRCHNGGVEPRLSLDLDWLKLPEAAD